MDNRLDFGPLVRDIILGFALALLLPLTFYWAAYVVYPEPKFEDFPCQYKNMSCVEVDKLIGNLNKRLGRLQSLHTTLAASSLPESLKQRMELEKEIDQLEEEVEATSSGLAKTRKARDTVLNEMKAKSHAVHLYLGIALSLAALLAGFFAPMLSLQIGFIMGSVLIIIVSYANAWDVMSGILKLIALLIAMILIIAMSFKFYKKGQLFSFRE